MTDQIAAGKIRVANFDQQGIFKNFCSSCYQQMLDGEATFIDFGSAWDGGTMRGEDGILISIDDLVVCEHCLRFAADLIGLVDGDEYKKQIEELTKEKKSLMAKLAMVKKDAT